MKDFLKFFNQQTKWGQMISDRLVEDLIKGEGTIEMGKDADEVIKLRDKLRNLGYPAKITNMSCFDIDQKGWTHYLSFDEAMKLSQARIQHPVDLHDYSEWEGPNKLYSFS